MSKTILVIDDDEAVRDSIASVLLAMDFDVVTAGDGLAGVKMFLMRRPNLVLTDIIMPVQEGIETIVAIRRMDPHVKIVAMSGGGRTSDENPLHLARKLGADHSLAKPFAFDVLIETLDKCFV